MIRTRVLRQQLLHARQEIIGDRAADTSIGKLDDVVSATAFGAAILKHRTIHADVAELVDDKRQPLAVGLGDDVADQRGFTGPEEPGYHGGGNTRLCHGSDLSKRNAKERRGGTQRGRAVRPCP